MPTALAAAPGRPVVAAADRVLSALARGFTAAGIAPPVVVALTQIRRAAATATIERYAERADALHASLATGGADPVDVRRAQAAMAQQALEDMRADVGRRAAAARLTAAAARFDEIWHAPELSEYLDDPDLDEDMRARLMHDLDRFNVLLDSYATFYRALSPLLDDARLRKSDGAPVRVLDLAAGHGGFAIWAAEQARREGRALHLTVTDLKAEYLDLGRARAEARGLPIDFRVQDALDLSNIGPGEFDAIICTQSLHHFPAGLIAPLFAGAYAAAGTGVLFVDGCRSAVHVLSIVLIGTLHYRDLGLVHDGVISLRRFFCPEELGLLCSLGPWRGRVRVRFQPPTHCVVLARC